MSRKGVSIITSYVLLIAIVIVIAALLFSLLKVYVPKEKPECKQGINLVIEKAVCSHTGGINEIEQLVLVNTGRFKIDRVFIRVGEADKIFKDDLQGYNPLERELNPEESVTLTSINLPSTYNKKKEYILQIQPLHKTDKGEFALCPATMQKIKCA